MKAVLLAGGTGSRMGELCRVTNKHLLPVGSKPMIFWPLEFLIRNEFDEILIVVGAKGCGEILRQVGSGDRWNVRIYYAFQEGEDGIAAALSLAEPWARDQFAVVLGDNIFADGLDLRYEMIKFRGVRFPAAKIFCTHHEHPELFGCAWLDGKGKVLGVVEKPKDRDQTTHDVQVVTGLYLYTPYVFEMIRKIVPSQRGELEISDVNAEYANRGRLFYSEVNGWFDCGTPALYHSVNEWALIQEQTLV